jgi:hypothetical protein
MRARLEGGDDMSATNVRWDLQGLYGLLLGGLISSFIGMTVFFFVSQPLESGKPWVLLATVLTGIACAGALMVGGLFTTERLPWLGSALLWASGFTTLWSLAVSFGAEPRWVTPLALGVAIAMGVAIGWRRFGHLEKQVTPDGEGA